MNEGHQDLQQLLHFEPAKNMSEKIYEQIAELINQGALPEGYTFPNETNLCKQLNVGRSSLREAYKALELFGYVTRTKRGTVVNSQQTILGATPLKDVVESSSDNDFLEFRLWLEGKTAALAAKRATGDELEHIRRILDDSWAAKNARDYDAMMELDVKFHFAVANATHNSLFISTMTAIAESWYRESKINFYKALASRPEVCEAMPSQHQQVFEAISSGNAENARKLMLSHIEYVSS